MSSPGLAVRPTMASLGGRYRPAQLAALAAILFLAAYAAGVILRPSEGYLNIQSNVVYNLPALAALGLSIIPIRRSRGRQRVAWICLATVLATWQAGDWIYTYYTFVAKADVPFPGLADAAYYPGYIAFVAAVPLLTYPARRMRDRRWAIDATVVMLVASVIAWEYLMKPILAENSGNAPAAAVALGYPMLDLALLTTLVVAFYASEGQFSWPALVLTVAVGLQIISDSGYTYVLLTTGYDNVGNPMELGWIAAYLLLAVCFLLPEEKVRVPAAIRPSQIGLALPYIAGVPLLGLLIAGGVRGHPSALLLAGSLGVVALVVLRQYLTLRENVALLTRAANFDDLTSLPNRRQFEQRLRRHLEESDKEGAQSGLLLVGLDDLKGVNDSLGHTTGDRVLVRVAQLLSDGCETGHVLARLEADEFVLLLPDTDSRGAEAAGQRLLQMVREQPIVVGDRMVRVTASAGAALLPQHGRTADDLLSCADLAMDEAKAAGGNTLRFYDPGSGQQALTEARLMWKKRIHNALEENRLVLYIQPIVDLKSRMLHEYEVLVRMLDEEGQPILPGSFLDVAERFGLVTEIDRWVIREAIRLLGEQRRRGFETRFAVNLSGRAFDDAELPDLIRRELADRDVPPNLLTLEVTETAAITTIDRAQKFINELRGLGCEFALDDFGVGFSSFAHLKHLPVNYLKIDGSFIRDLLRDDVDQYLVKAMVEVARGLDRKTIAEFVQDEETLQMLRNLGVDYGQGYYLGRPAPASEVFALRDGLVKAA